MESHLENSKYYVPEISEFHVGFEYECTDLDHNGKSYIWIPQKYDGEEMRTYLTKELSNSEIRIKYLDQSDIESLGWIKHAALENDYFKESQEQNLYGTIYLNINNFSKELLIEDDRTGDYLFKGTIKNKSELIKLQQQLNIK